MKIIKLKNLLILLCTGLLFGCAATEPPRLVTSVSSSNSKTLMDPEIEVIDNKNFEITYAEISIGFDSGCNPFKSFSDELNQCSKLPENVKQMAIKYCQKSNKTAMFLGNGRSLLQMTVSKFSCEQAG